jgi:hypothetical protein
MKVINKKAILGMLVAMIMSLGMMSGINSKTTDSNVQQVSMGCAAASACTEDAWSAGFSQAASITGDICVGIFVGGATASVVSTTNPVGWGWWLTTAVAGL